MLNKCLLAVGLLGWASIANAAAERRFLLIPPYPIEQTVSEEMRERISAFDRTGVFMTFESWEPLTELPAWVFEKSKREIAYIFARPMACDDYSYAVIAGRHDKVIIVRTGGISGNYEIFSKKVKRSTRAAKPSTSQAPSRP